MTIRIRLTDNLKHVDLQLGEIKNKTIVTSMRQALNKSIVSARKMAIEQIQLQRKLKTSYIKNKQTYMDRARGSKIEHLYSSIKFMSKSIALIEFLRGKKEPRSQKGIKPKSRRKIRVQVKPGKNIRLHKGFLARGHGGKVNVFRRTDNKVRKPPNQKGPLAIQKMPSIARLVEKPKISTPLQNFAAKRLGIEFERALNYQLQKIR